MSYECKFLDGVADGRAIETEDLHKKLWLLNVNGARRWTFHEPTDHIEAIYELCGTAGRVEGPHLALYGWVLPVPPDG